MKNMRHMLAVIAGLTLVLSIMSSVSGNALAGFKAFAQDDNGHNNSGLHGNSTSSNNEHYDEHGNKTSSDNMADNQNNREHINVELHAEDKGIQMHIELNGLNMTDGSYNATFSCTEPQINKTLDSMFEVKNGTGRIEAKIALDNGTYSGCELVTGTTVIATFNSFTVKEHAENDNHDEAQNHRHDIVSRGNGTEIHERHMKAKPSSPGDYKPGLNFTLAVQGSAVNATDLSHSTNATVGANMSVWKSNSAIVLLDITGGSVQVGGQTYDIEIGYALYSPHFGAFKMGALVSDDSGNILRLVLRGNTSENTGLPTQSGNTIKISLGDGNGQSSNLEDLALALDGTIKAN